MVLEDSFSRGGAGWRSSASRTVPSDSTVCGLQRNSLKWIGVGLLWEVPGWGWRELKYSSEMLKRQEKRINNQFRLEGNAQIKTPLGCPGSDVSSFQAGPRGALSWEGRSAAQGKWVCAWGGGVGLGTHCRVCASAGTGWFVGQIPQPPPALCCFSSVNWG